MAKVVVTEREVRIARAFLHATHGNEASSYLLLAVIQWMRAMKKAGDPVWKAIAKLAVKSAGALLAKRLMDRARKDPNGYKGVLAALRRYGSKGTTNQANAYTQGADFLTALSQSKWDSKHYGYHAGHEGYWLTRALPNGSTETIWVPPYNEVNPLVQQWNGTLLGHPIPPKWFVDVVKPPTPPRKVTRRINHQPRSFIHPHPTFEYIQPYAAGTFYNARPHLNDYVMPSDPRMLDW